MNYSQEVKEIYNDIVDDCIHGNWRDAANRVISNNLAVEDLIKLNKLHESLYEEGEENLNYFDDKYDIAVLIDLVNNIKNGFRN